MAQEAPQPGVDLVIVDDVGDTMVDSPLGPIEGVPAGTLAPALLGAVDFTEVRIGEETPESLTIGFSVVDFTRPNVRFVGGVNYAICFFWAEGGGHYQVALSLSYTTRPDAELTRAPEYAGLRMDFAGDDCPLDAFVQSGGGVAGEQMQWTLDVDAGTFDMRVPRQAFAEIPVEGDGPRPDAGQSFAQVRAGAWLQQSLVSVAYDEAGGDGLFSFAYEAGNEAVRVTIEDTYDGYFPGRPSLLVPVYSVSVGDLQAVPFTVENHMDVPLDARLDVQILEGDANLWTVSTLPSVAVSEGNQTTPGAETLTLVVGSAPTVSHKDRVRVLVTARDAAFPDRPGIAVVDVMAVVPPTRAAPTLHFHHEGLACSDRGYWTNVLQGDGASTEVPFVVCGQDTTDDDPFAAASRLATVGTVARSFGADVPFGRDYRLAGDTAGSARVALKSIQFVPEVGEVRFPSDVDVTVTVFAGLDAVASGTVELVALDGTPTIVDVPITVARDAVTGEGSFSAEDAFSVEVTIDTRPRVYDYGGVCIDTDTCVPEGTLRVYEPPGRVVMVLADSDLTLPIIASEIAGPRLQVSPGGARVTLTQLPYSGVAAGDVAVVNPGKGAVFDFRVRNEGLNVDTVTTTVVLDQEGWDAEILPVLTHELEVGEPALFQVRVVAPADADEGERVQTNVTATSGVDPVASATERVAVLVTTGERIDDVRSDFEKPKERKKTPAPSMIFPVLAAVALVGLLRRRTV